MALVLALALVLFSCGKDTTSSVGTSSEDSTESFVKPEQYASVLLVTINPQFRLYLDENQTVLAVEAVNEDAESIKDSISFQNESLDTVIENIVTAANNNGFVKADATISFEIVESKETDTAQADILSKAQKKANDTAEALKIEIKVDIGEIPTSSDISSSEAEPSDNQGTTESANQNPPESEQNNNQDPVTPAHTHSFSAATCTEPKKCSCGEVEGTALRHNYKDGVCTRCNAKDPNFKPTSVLKKQGKWTFKYLYGNELRSVSIIVCNSEKNYVDVGIGILLSSLPSDMQNDPNTKEYCEEFNGELYYIGMGDGDDIKTLTEENSTVTLTNSSGNKLVLTRTGENTMKYTSSSDTFKVLSALPDGAEFTFVAE